MYYKSKRGNKSRRKSSVSSQQLVMKLLRRLENLAVQPVINEASDEAIEETLTILREKHREKRFSNAIVQRIIRIKQLIAEKKARREEGIEQEQVRHTEELKNRSQKKRTTKTDFASVFSCPLCGGPMTVSRQRYQEIWRCQKFPQHVRTIRYF